MKKEKEEVKITRRGSDEEQHDVLTLSPLLALVATRRRTALTRKVPTFHFPKVGPIVKTTQQHKKERERVGDNYRWIRRALGRQER